MKVDAYKTVACRSYDTKKIEYEARRAYIEGTSRHISELNLHGTNSAFSLFNICAVTEKSGNVPPFSQPILLPRDGHDTSPIVAIDIRPFVSYKRDGGLKISSPSDLDFLILRAGATVYWNSDGAQDLASVGDFPVLVYSRWVSESISRRLALDPDAQMRISIIAAYFYLCQFRKAEDITETVKMRMVARVARATNVNAERCMVVLDDVEPMSGLEDFLTQLSKIDNVRMEKLNAGLLVGITSTGWFGANAQENMAVALEYPPAFISILYSALNHRGYHRAMFTKLVQSADRRGASKDFTYNLSRLPKL